MRRCSTLLFALLVALIASLMPAASRAQTGDVKTVQAQALNVQIARFAMQGAGSVNTYWISAPGGLIVVDFQRDRETASQALAQIRQSGRPVVALLLTHAHPDHIGGLAQFKAAYPDAPLLATRLTADELASDGQGYQALTRKILGAAAPTRYPAPDRIIESGKELTIAGLTVMPLELGMGEATSATAYFLPQTGDLFGGDIAVMGMTDFLMEGRTGSWLAQLNKVAAAFPAARTLHPGHGSSGDPQAIISHARSMLMLYRSVVQQQIDAGEAPGGALTVKGQAAVEAKVRDQLGDQPPVALVPDLVRENAKAVARELTR